MPILFKTLGAMGVILIAGGILINNRKKENILYFLGGLFLEIYSIFLKDPIFIVLQIVFMLSVAYDYIQARRGL